MTKTLSLIMLGLLVFSIGAVSAKTVIAGKIYNADFTDTISEADVNVLCNGNTLTAISRSDGSYNVEFDNPTDCEAGDSLTVSAVKGDLYGSETGIIHDDVFGNNWDLAIVNVPLVPEFGLIVGVLTILSAVGVFFFVRRE